MPWSHASRVVISPHHHTRSYFTTTHSWSVVVTEINSRLFRAPTPHERIKGVSEPSGNPSRTRIPGVGRSNDLCQSRYCIGIDLGIRDLDQNRKMTVYAGIGVTKPQSRSAGIAPVLTPVFRGGPNPDRHRSLGRSPYFTPPSRKTGSVFCFFPIFF